MKIRFLHIAFVFLNAAGMNEVAAQCTAPSGLSSTAVSGTESDLTWTGGGASNWNVEYGPLGFTLGSGTYITATSTTLPLTGLSQNVAYEFYVRDSCGVDSLSTWTGPQDIALNVVPCDDMEAYSLGNVSDQSLLLLGWAGSGGDGEFSSDYASAGSQSLKIYDSGTNGFSDIVANFPSYTSGIHNVKFDFYVPVGYGGYYNILHNYVGASGNVWAIEVYLDSSGVATVEEGTNGSGTIGTYDFNMGAWNTVEHIINLDDDTAFVKINGEYTDVGWQFSLGATSGEQFNGVNFYSTANGSQTPLTYFDEFCITVPPTNDVGVIGFAGPDPLCGDSNYPINVVIQNFAENSFGPFLIFVNVSGSATLNTNQTYTGPIHPGQTDTITIDEINNVNGGTYNITGYTTNFMDTVLNNDTTVYMGVVVHPNPNINLGPNIKYCSSDTGFSEVLMAGNTNDTILWNTGDTSNSITVVADGTYDVTVVNQYGCIDRDTIVVTEFDPVNVDLGPDLGDCEGQGGTYTLNAGSFPNASYAWNVQLFSQVITTTFPGIYIVTVTTDGVCESKDTLRIWVYEYPEINLNDTTVCGGDTVVFDAGNPGSSYSWNTGDTSQVVTSTSSGTFAVTVTSEHGCASSDTAELVVNVSPFVILGNDTIIEEGQSLTLDAGNAGSTYLWSTGATTQTINVTTTGTYSVTVTNSNGCSSVGDIVVTFQVGIEDNQGGKVVYYPNPTSGQLNIRLESVQSGELDFEIYNMSGALVHKVQKMGASSGSNYQIDLGSLPGGVYFMNVVQDSKLIGTFKVGRM